MSHFELEIGLTLHIRQRTAGGDDRMHRGQAEVLGKRVEIVLAEAVDLDEGDGLAAPVKPATAQRRDVVGGDEVARSKAAYRQDGRPPVRVARDAAGAGEDRGQAGRDDRIVPRGIVLPARRGRVGVDVDAKDPLDGTSRATEAQRRSIPGCHDVEIPARRRMARARRRARVSSSARLVRCRTVRSWPEAAEWGA
ncbi:MAG: hypothetical protein JOZ41_00580 [Chloroflexi bacterium]|nr:hypothetical protein [Chloroflexota bacterium]